MPRTDWSMPRPLLQVVAGALVAVAVGSFSLGVATAPSRGRLPGERSDGASQAVQAVEATPLSQERIEGPPPPPEPTPEELAKLEADKKAREEAEAARIAAEQALASAPPPVVAPAPAPDRVGDILQNPPPPPAAEDPPF
ncbi:hypothetical protein [Phenylobacterium sp. J367]|uniref:hypothetical protein n=1 Tax=Phenylobacterium sp. J367 TaxID=2898435 RepID=UPI0021515F27|nr:hypothetical protein [Phenylobacterium sp. J367]MCR5878143.1 hypothetical protein [Phenylobacterium sp. J367]